MGQIFFVNSFAKTQVTGGIKTIYNHAKLLREKSLASTHCKRALETIQNTLHSKSASSDVNARTQAIHHQRGLKWTAVAS
jgi:hypothetical protein